MALTRVERPSTGARRRERSPPPVAGYFQRARSESNPVKISCSDGVCDAPCLNTAVRGTRRVAAAVWVQGLLL